MRWRERGSCVVKLGDSRCGVLCWEGAREDGAGGAVTKFEAEQQLPEGWPHATARPNRWTVRSGDKTSWIADEVLQTATGGRLRLAGRRAHPCGSASRKTRQDDGRSRFPQKINLNVS